MFELLGQMWQFIQNPAPEPSFISETVIYLQLCIVSTLLAIVVALPLGILVAQRQISAFLLTNFTGLMRAVPTLVFFALAYPYLGLGFKPAVIALTVIGIPPILLNTIAGLRGIDAATVDAARGMGMTSLQVLWRIQIPLTLPVVAAGVRTAAVQIVATAPLAALIGGAGYGDYIIGGLGLINIPIVLAGVIPVALLALLFEVALAGVQRLLTPAGLRVSQPSAEEAPTQAAASSDQPLAA
jgi:osmoprotectant transport system permease protein